MNKEMNPMVEHLDPLDKTIYDFLFEAWRNYCQYNEEITFSSFFYQIRYGKKFTNPFFNLHMVPLYEEHRSEIIKMCSNTHISNEFLMRTFYTEYVSCKNSHINSRIRLIEAVHNYLLRWDSHSDYAIQHIMDLFQSSHYRVIILNNFAPESESICSALTLLTTCWHAFDLIQSNNDLEIYFNNRVLI